MSEEKKTLSFEEIADTAATWAEGIPIDAPGAALEQRAFLVLVAASARRSTELKTALAAMNKRLTESIVALEQQITNMLTVPPIVQQVAGDDAPQPDIAPVNGNGANSVPPVPGIPVPPMPPGVTVTVKP